MLNHPSFRSWLSRVTRREVLSCAAGLGVSFLAPGLDLRAVEKRGRERPKSLITLFLAGGPSQMELFDPHPESKHSVDITAIGTSIPGLSFSHFLPRIAEKIHHLNVIRSLVSKEGDHERGTYFVQTGYRPDPTVVHPAIGAVLCSQLESQGLEIPSHVSLASGDGFLVPRGGYVGDEFDAYRIFDPGKGLDNLRQRVDDTRQQRRLAGLDVVTSAFREGRALAADRTLHQRVVGEALTMMRSEQLRAFELEHESRETLQRYGDSRFGRGCLVARRLVEQGVRAVQVVLGGFDSHANNFEVQQARARDLDPALAALVQDLVERDLLESTVLLCIGEFGRTPWLNALEGRDHWPHGFSCLLGGGGFTRGTVIGATPSPSQYDEQDRRAAARVSPSDPIQIPDLFATVLQVMGLSPEQEILTPIGRPIKLAAGTPIDRLIAHPGSPGKS